MDLRDGRYISPSTPSDQVFFDTATPTTGGVIFDPNTPALADTLYVSSLNGSTWIYRDGTYVTYTAPVVNNTEWYIKGTSIDAGGNKTTAILRSGPVYASNLTGINTGDETVTTIKSKLGITTLSGSNTGDQDLSGLVVKANNLSDLSNITTARTNLGLGTLATQSGTFSGTSSGTNTGDQTFLNARVQTVTSSATVTPVSTNDLVIITAQAAGLTLANPTGTFTEGQALMIRIKDNGTARTIAFDTNYRAIGVTLPTTTVISKTLYLGIIYNATDGKWDIVGYNLQA